MQIVHIQPEAWHVIEQDSLQSFPNECCGFLYGSDSPTQRLITAAVPVHNSQAGDQRRRFEIAPLAYLRAEQYAEAQGVTLLGVYHSHPLHPAVASEHDLAKALPFFSYVITSVFEDGVRNVQSWQLNAEGSAFFEETIEVATRAAALHTH